MTSPFTKAALRTTVSAAALAFLTGQAALAQDTSPRMWASIEGQYAMFHGDAIDFGSGLDLSPDNGWAGALKIGGKVGEDWFAEAGIRYGKSGKDSFSYSAYPYDFLDIDYEEDHLILDLQIGRDIGIGNGGSARVYGGVRFARFSGDGDLNAYSYYYYGPVGFNTDHKFNGVGPRVGVDAMIPVANNLSVDVGASAAVLYGKRKLKVTFSYYGYGYGLSGSTSKKKFIPNVDASAAMTYRFSQYATISAGYRASQFWNVVPEISSGGIKSANRLIHGPFLQLTFTN